MNRFHFLSWRPSKVIRKSLILLLIILIALGFIPNPKVRGATIPAGVIVAWPYTNASIPSGWIRVTALDGRFVKMIPNPSTNPGGTGGASTHDHPYPAHSHAGGIHSHAATTTGPSNYNFSSFFSTGGGSLGSHTHSTNISQSVAVATSGVSAAGSWGSVSNNPNFFEVIFIKSDGTPTGVPNGAIVWWNTTTPPVGWRAADGTNGAPDLRNRFMRGAATGGDAGTTGGNTGNHSHTGPNHTHPASGITHNHDVTTNAGGGGGSWGGTSPAISALINSHSHGTVQPEAADGSHLDANTEMSSSNDGSPPWYKLYAIQNNTGSLSYPNNIIVMWDWALASIPTTWKLADGNSGTPNLLDKYVRGLNTTIELGNTGGAYTHTHIGNGHSHTSSHSHGGPGNQICACGQAFNGPSPEGSGAIHASGYHGHSLSLPSSTVTSGSTANNAPANITNEPLFTTLAYIQFQNQNPNVPTLMGLTPMVGSQQNKDGGNISLQATATDPDPSDTIKVEWDYSANSGGAWINIGVTPLGPQGSAQTLSWDVSGLSLGNTYRLRARTIDNKDAISGYTTQSGDWALASGCSPPVNGDFVIGANCAFLGSVDGIDAGNMTINSDVTLTINAGQIIVFNSDRSIFVNGSIAMNSTGQIEETNLWMVDSDSDGWPATTSQSAQDSSPGPTYRRRNLLQSITIPDCNDSIFSSSNSC